MAVARYQLRQWTMGARMDDWGLRDVGAAGGLLTALVAVAVAIGKGIVWLLQWGDHNAEAREAKLQAWEASLVERERAMRIEIEEKLSSVEQEVTFLREVLSEVAGELHKHAPESPKLARAVRALGIHTPG